MEFDTKSLAEILGHSHISTTLSIYVHPSLQQKRIVFYYFLGFSSVIYIIRKRSNGRNLGHENTKADKEKDRICHVDTMNAQTGPIFLAYRQQPKLKSITDAVKSSTVTTRL
mgnify:CR=1 FL=1